MILRNSSSIAGSTGWSRTFYASQFGFLEKEMEPELGKTRWAIADGYIPASSSGLAPHMKRHEMACILNATPRTAQINITIYFQNREPVGPYRVEVPANRTLHLKFDELDHPEPIPVDTDFASVFTSDVPVVVQHTRFNSKQAENALLSTIAFSG